MNILVMLAAAGAAVSLWTGAAKYAGPEARGYRWLGVGALFWLIGFIIDTVLSAQLGSSGAALSLADVAPLIAIAAITIGIMVLGSGGPAGSIAGLADGYVMAVALLVIGWVGAFGAEYHNSGERAEAFLFNLLHPLVDLAVLGALLPVLTVAWRRVLLPYLSLLVLLGADSLGVGARISGGHEGILQQLAMIVAACLLGVGPWLDTIAARLAPPPSRRESGRAREASRSREGGFVREGARGAERMAGAALAPFSARRGPVTSAGAATIIAAVSVVIAAFVIIVNGLGSAPATSLALVIAGGAATFVFAIRVLMLVRENGVAIRLWRHAGSSLREFADQTGDIVMLCDLDGTITYISPSATGFSYTPEELSGRQVTDFVHPEDLPRVQAMIRRVVRAAETFTGLADIADPADTTDPADIDPADEGTGEEQAGGGQGSTGQGSTGQAGQPGNERRFSCRVRSADGTWRHLECAVLLYRMPGEPARILLTARDMSDQVALRQQVNHLTFHDGLTGLPNRAYVEERTRDALAAIEQDTAEQRGEDASAPAVAVIFLDLDGFTAVNDLVGHGAGDTVLAQAARRLRAVVPTRDTVARWGGDEFAVLVENLPGPQEIGELAERLAGIIAGEPFRAADREIGLTASVGVALADGSPTDTLLRNADVAMSRAKDGGGDRVEVYAAHMHADVVRRLDLAAALQRALANEELTLQYQPIVELATSRVTGAEALVRWWRGDEAVPAGEFLAVAEESGLIVSLGEWVLREACAQGAAWRAAAWDVGVSVNLSLRQLRAPRCTARVADALAGSGLPAEALTIEVNERSLVDDADVVAERLGELRELGVRLAIDDFGTGYAALAHLRELPVDIIKIDPSFVAELGQDATLGMLTKTIVQLGHDLGIEVVAEGIEQPRQLAELREMGCGYGQGFLVARPMGVSGVETMIRTSSGTGPGDAQEPKSPKSGVPAALRPRPPGLAQHGHPISYSETRVLII